MPFAHTHRVCTIHDVAAAFTFSPYNEYNKYLQRYRDAVQLPVDIRPIRTCFLKRFVKQLHKYNRFGIYHNCCGCFIGNFNCSIEQKWTEINFESREKKNRLISIDWLRKSAQIFRHNLPFRKLIIVITAVALSKRKKTLLNKTLTRNRNWIFNETESVCTHNRKWTPIETC